MRVLVFQPLLLVTHEYTLSLNHWGQIMNHWTFLHCMCLPTSG